MTIESFITWLGFCIGALAGGIWTALAVHWWRHERGVLRTSLVAISIYVISNLALRVYVQVSNWQTEMFDGWITLHRILLNVFVLVLGLYLAKNSGRINREGE